MLTFIIRRLAILPLMFLGMVFFVFVLTNLIPADPARVAVGPDASPESVERMREKMGLNKSLPEQFTIYLWDVVRLDLGTSIRDNRPVYDSIINFAPASIELALASTVVVVVVGVLMGIYSAAYQGRGLDRLLRLGAITGRAFPAFWLALLLQIVFFARLGWFPSGGRIDLITMDPPRKITGLYLVDSVVTLNWDAFVSSAYHLALPVTALALGGIAEVLRMTRGQVMLEMNSDYARTARSKGLTDRTVLFRHIVRNAINPVVTIIGIRFGYLLAGTVLIESIFRWPGLGRYALQAIQNLDFPALMGVTLFVTLMFVLVNLMVDVIYGFLDPRIKYT